MGVQRVGGLEVWDIQVIKDEGREAGGQMEPLRAAVRHSDLVCIAQGSLSGCLITSHLSWFACLPASLYRCISDAELGRTSIRWLQRVFYMALSSQQRANIKCGVFPQTCHLICNDSSDVEKIERKCAISSCFRPPHCCLLLCSGLSGRPCLTTEGKLKQFSKTGCCVYSWYSSRLTAGMKKKQPMSAPSKPDPESNPRWPKWLV